MLLLDIAIGKHRHSKRWINTQISWDDLCKRVSKTHRTPETLKEYFELPKYRQDEIKDVGGFVSGTLAGGRRLLKSVLSKQLITLDADTAKADIWDKYKLLYGKAACIYTTHKHTPQAPRVRLLIPLDREVLHDEYTAICRRIASDLGIEQFDPTGYEVNRLMYFPSTSIDGVFFYDKLEAPVLKADDVLATYKDWRDVTQWALSEKEKEITRRTADKQGDPLEKTGLVGAFCKTYSIKDVLNTILADVYAPTAIDDRYTYIKGSTSGGLIVYDDKYTFSHHSTDPTNSKLCNAFDLVRLHKYAHLDEDAEPDTPINRRPSFIAMCDFASSDKNVVQLLGRERLQAATDAFKYATEPRAENNVALLAGRTGLEAAELTESLTIDAILGLNEGGSKALIKPKAKDSDEWLADMDVDRKGNYLTTINNIALILQNDPIFKDNIVFNTFESMPMFKRATPWRSNVYGRESIISVSYTHLTLPTKRIV